MRFNCTSLWTLYFSDKDIERRFYCVYLRRVLKKKEKRSTSYLPLYTLTQRILSTSITCYPPHFPFFLFSSLNCQRSLPSLSPFSRHQILLPSFFSIFPSLSVYLSVCLSVCPSLATSHAHSHNQSATQVRITPIHLVHWLTRSRSHTHIHTLVGFLFLFHTHSDCTYVTTWTLFAESGIYCSPILFTFLSLVKRARKSKNEKKKKKMWTCGISSIESKRSATTSFFLL